MICQTRLPLYNMAKRFLWLISLLLWASIPISGQNTTAGITGSVRNADGPLEAVSIQIVNLEHGGNYGTTTNRYGIYSLSGLKPGEYDAVFSFIGYRTLRVDSIRLSLGEEYRLDVELATDNNLLDDVDISAEYSHFDETRTGQTYSIRNERLELLPSIGRSLTDYSRLSIYSGLDNAMDGRDGRLTRLTIDGAGLSNSFGLSSALPGGGNPVSVDAIDEVQVVIAPYDVRQSNFTGGGINAVTKSGTNTFKASAYVYHTNEHLRGNSVDGNSLGDRKTEAKSIYGLTLGGPIIRDRLFFFVNGELERRPGPISEWTLSQDGRGDGAAQVSRVTQADMDRFSTALSKYGYSAGTTDLSDGGLTNGKILARLDWRISDNHDLMVRYNYTENKDWYVPNNTSTVGTKAASNRVSMNAYAFRSNCYSINDVAWSAVAELNSRVGVGTNRLLLTVSNVSNSRGTDSEEFPHIDIWKDGDAFMSAGYELFSHTGNHTYTYNVSDHYRWVIGHTTATAGLEYELVSANTNYMSYASGYYRYSSIEDFESSAAPVAFGYTYGYEDNDDSSSRSTVGRGSAFVQGETRIADRLQLTYGLRADLTGYSSEIFTNSTYLGLDWSRHFYADSENVPSGWQSPRFNTGRWPSASVQFSPRLGFNWDVSGNGNIVIRGGTGLFAGRMPMVFLTNIPNYSNMLQNTVAVTSDADGFLSGLSGNFIYREKELRNYLAERGYPMVSNPDAPLKSASICGVGENFKLPQVLKASLAADWTVPFSFPATISIEGLFDKDINAVCSRNYNVLNEGDFEHFAGTDSRTDYRKVKSGSGSSPYVYDNVTGGAMMICNTSKGYSWSVAATAVIEPVRNLRMEFSYIHQDTWSMSDMTGSSLFSTWKNIAAVNNPNDDVLRRSAYSIPDRVVASATYSVSHGRRFSTSAGLFYSGSRSGRFSYVCTNDMNGDGFNNDLIYIPASEDDIRFVDNGKYSAAEQRKAFWNFVCGDSYLSRCKGEYAGANEALTPWLNRFDIRLTETMRIGKGRNSHRIQLSVDLMNVGNLLNDSWGVQYTPSGCNDGKILNYVGTDAAGVPLYTLYSDSEGLLKDAFRPLQSTDNCWYLQFGLRYILN